MDFSGGTRVHRNRIEKGERRRRKPPKAKLIFDQILQPAVLVMTVLYFLHNCAAYGCMTFFTNGLKGQDSERSNTESCFHSLRSHRSDHGFKFSSFRQIPGTSRPCGGHVFDERNQSYFKRGAEQSLLDLVWLHVPGHPGPVRGHGSVLGHRQRNTAPQLMGHCDGLVNAFGNLGGFAGPYFTGWLLKQYHSTGIAFSALGAGMLVCVALAFLLPKPIVQNKLSQTV